MEINDIIQSKRRMVQERIEKSFGVDIEKARMAGDTKVKNGKTFVWTEYAPGKFDWRISNKKTTINPASRKKEKEQPNIRENDKKGEYYKDYKYRASQPKTWDEWKKVLGGEVKIRSGRDIMVDGKKVGIVSGDEIFFNKPEKEQPTASVKVPRGIMMPDEDAWVEIYDKNGKKIKEDFFEELGFDPDEEWNEKDGNYDIKGGGKMVVPKEHNTRIVEDTNESIKKLEEDEEDESIKRFEQYGEEISQQIKDDKERKERLSRVNDKKLKAWKDRNKKKEKRKAKAQKDVIAALEADQGGLLDDEDSKKKIEAIKQAAAEFVEKNPDLNLTIEDWETIVDGSEIEDYEDYEGFEKLNDCIESYF